MKIYKAVFTNLQELLISAEDKIEAQIMAEEEAKKQKTKLKKIEVRKLQP